MAMQTCKVCGKQYRTGRLVFIMSNDGRLKGARVCQGCADGGVTVVAKKPIDFCTYGGRSGCDRPATMCHVHAVASIRGDNAKGVEGAIKALEAQSVAISRTAPGSQSNADDFTLGKAEAYDNIIAFLKEGRW